MDIETAKQEFSDLLDKNREEVKARRDTVRQQNNGRAMSEQRMKFLRKMAEDRKKDN